MDTDIIDPDKCENPECQNRATQKHHIFPGRGRRKRCDVLGYVVDCCHICHHKSHHESGRQEWWQRLWCKVKGLDFETALRIANMSKLERREAGSE